MLWRSGEEQEPGVQSRVCEKSLYPDAPAFQWHLHNASFFFFPSAYVRAARYTIYLFGARYRFAPLAFRIKPANKYPPSLLSLVHESGFCIRGRVGPLHKPCQNLKPSAYTPHSLTYSICLSVAYQLTRLDGNHTRNGTRHCCIPSTGLAVKAR